MTHPTRIAYLVSRYPAVSHTFILREVVQLRSLGYEVVPASINQPDQVQLTEQEQQEMQRTYYVKQHGWRGALLAHAWGWLRLGQYWQGLWFALRLAGLDLVQLLYNLFYFTEALMLARWMQQQNLRHLHVHFATAASNVALILKKMAPISLSLTVHGPDEFYDAHRLWLGKKIAAADFVVCISHYARSQLMLLSEPKHWHKFEVCPLGVDVAEYQPAVRTVPQPFTVLCVGRLTPAKGQYILLQACQKLLQQGRELKLMVVGAGPDHVSLQSYVIQHNMQQQVVFTGALNSTQVQQQYANSDAFVLASFAEGVPVVLMEAMASGVPCISTRITGIPELIEAGVQGLLVSPSSVDELADAIAHLQDSPHLRCNLAQHARQKVAQCYNLQQNVARLANIYARRMPAMDVPLTLNNTAQLSS